MTLLDDATTTWRSHLTHAQFIDLDGWNAHVLSWNCDGTAPVLLLHGFTAHAQSWQHLAHALAPDRYVLALDQRGHGRSERTTRFGSRPMVADIGVLLDRLHLDRITLVGQSMGGANALLFAAAHPERVERLVLIDVGPEAAPEGIARIAANTQGKDRFASPAEALDAAKRSFPLADEELLAWRVRHNLVQTRQGDWTWRTDASLRDRTARRDDHSVEERWAAWASIDVPTLLVHGAQSDVLTQPIIDRMTAVRPNITVVHLEGAGHAVPLDQPAALAEAVRAFLAAEPFRLATALETTTALGTTRKPR